MDDLPQIPKNKDITYIGYSTYRDKNTLFGIKRKDRRQHVYILGKSGTGKSVLMSNMVMQNILSGEGVCVVDPHGEFVEELLGVIPEHRIKDVVYFNPADPDYHIGFNVLELEDSKYKHLVASGLMGIFTKIWANAWSARMEYILNNAILALLDTPGTTMLGIPRMLVDKDYRQKIISNLKDPVIKSFWVYEYEAWQDKFRNEAIAPIQNKVGQFLSTSIIRNVVGQSKSTINIFNIMNEGKIFLVNVSKGRIGEDNSSLLGGMLITKIQLAAMERVRIPEDERRDFYLYVDEFQNFVTDSFASILSEARKYRLNLTVAHQYTAQLVTKESSAMRDSIFGNVGTMIVFRVGADDADFLEKEFMPEFTPEDVVNLPNFKIYLKLMIDGITSRPFSAKTIAPLVKNKNIDNEKIVIESSRKIYCRGKEEVEKEINDWSGMSLGDIPNSKGVTYTGEKFTTVCSLCKNQTQVPFKPELGRAVYCKDCITKIKAGELKPIKVSPNQLKEDEARFFSPLSDLGIEFESPLNISKKNKEEKFIKKESDIRKKEEERKPKLITNIKKVFSNNFIKNKSEKDNLGLKEILNKALENKDISEIKDNRETLNNESKKEGDEMISLNDLKFSKNKVETIKIKNDRSAPPEEMNSFKNMVLEKESIIKEDVKEVDKKEEPLSEKIKYDKPYSTLVLDDKPSSTIASESGKNIKKEEEINQTNNQNNQTNNQNNQTNNQNNQTKDNDQVNQNNVKEVPEEVLRKILEEEK